MKRFAVTVFLSAFWIVLCTFSGYGQEHTPPVPLQVKLVNSVIQLIWNTAEDSLDCIVERSRDAQSFEMLSAGRLSRKTGDSSYLFTDHFPHADSGFYRISWIGPDRSRVYTAVSGIQVPAQPKTEFTIMPNPVFNNATLIIYHEELGELTCTLYDLAGKIIRSYQFKKNTLYMQHILDMYTVPGGSYILNIRGTTINESKRVMKQ